MRYCPTAGLRARNHIKGGNGIIVILSEIKCLSPELGGIGCVFKLTANLQMTTRRLVHNLALIKK